MLQRRILRQPTWFTLTMQELVFAGERCENDKCLADYSINREFIKQVGIQMLASGSGTVINDQSEPKPTGRHASSTKHGQP